MKKTFKDWVMATRPWSLPASSMSVVTASMFMWWVAECYGFYFDWLNAVLALVSMMFFQLGGNLTSDWHDYVNGVDKPGEESVQILTSGQFSKREVEWFAFVMLLIACAIGMVIFLRSGWLTLFIGIAGLLFAVFYYFMKYNAMGDLTILLEYALFPMFGISFITVDRIYLPILLLAFVVGPVTISILHANNARDIPSDNVSCVKTFAMVIGLKASQWYYMLGTIGPYLLIVVGILTGLFPWTTITAFIALPMAIVLNKDVNKLMNTDLPFSGIDQRTAGLQLVFSLLLSAGFAVAAIAGI